jgi:nitrate reductase delta subunit
MTTALLPATDPQVREELFTLASLLLQYPDAELVAAGPALLECARALPEEVGRDGVVALAELLGSAPAIESQRRYVETFDLRRRSSLDLTYYLHGDTRKRGIALLTLKQRYRAAGFTVTDRVLPDFLPVVLEFAATAGPGPGEAPLRQHRQGLGVLATALHEAGSPYAAVVDAVCAVLPEMTDADRAAIAALAADGPLDELVGLEHPSLIPPPSAVQESCS